MIYAALPTLMRDFGDPAGVGWLITAYLLVGSVSAGLSSRLGDLFGRKRLVLAMLACSASGSLISALSSGLPGLICGRALQGMSAALLPLAIGIVRERLRAERVPVAIGWLTAMATFSAGAGLLLGGLLVDHAGWRTMFWFGAVHGVVAMVLVARWVPASAAAADRRAGRLDRRHALCAGGGRAAVGRVAAEGAWAGRCRDARRAGRRRAAAGRVVAPRVAARAADDRRAPHRDAQGRAADRPDVPVRPRHLADDAGADGARAAAVVDRHRPGPERDDGRPAEAAVQLHGPVRRALGRPPRGAARRPQRGTARHPDDPGRLDRPDRAALEPPGCWWGG